jgi:hypothetical protein
MVEDAVYVIREVIAWFKGRRPSDEAVTALVQAVHATEALRAPLTAALGAE